jgi:prephenate dehydratase
MIVHHLGPPGTFSEAAALHFGEVLKPQATMEGVAEAVAGDAAAVGVLPYYNLLEGLVQEPVDLIYSHRLHVVAARRLPIVFAAGCAGELADVRRVVSHPKALAQCSGWLRANLPDVPLEAAASTAQSATLAAASAEVLGIAPAATIVAAGLNLIADDIGNKPAGRTNFTDFLLIQQDLGEARHDGRTLVAITPDADEPGLLGAILQQFAFHRLNVAKIHSRPALDVAGTAGIDAIEPQMFYAEVMAGSGDEALRRAVDALRFHFRSSREAVRVLGGWADEGTSAKK